MSIRTAPRTRTARRATAPAALALALGLVLTACADGSDDSDDAPVAAETVPADDAASDDATQDADDGDDGTDSDTDDDNGDDASADQGGAPERPTAAGLRAIATAEEEAGGTAYAIDDPDRDHTWEVDVATNELSVEVEVSADGGEVIRTENDDLDADDRRALADAKFSLPQAIERTVAKAGGTLDDAELDEDDPRYHWSVTVDQEKTKDVDYRVDTQSGKVTKDRDDNDRDDDGADDRDDNDRDD